MRAPPPSQASPFSASHAESDRRGVTSAAGLGGGALTLGGLFLVVYAAQRGFFTPLMRVLAAAFAGLVMVAASEWIRRQRNVPGGRHLLAAALAAGAGAATVYGAIWAAHGLYALVPLGVAAILIALVSLALLGLSLLHGEPLALLALAGGFAAPIVTGFEGWDAAALDGYLLALILTGYGAAGLRRWGRAGAATLAGATLWALQGVALTHELQAGLLLLGAAAGAAVAAEWRRPAPAQAPTLRSSLFELQPTLAIAAGGAILLLAWTAAGPDLRALPEIVGFCALLAALGAATIARALAPASVYAVLAAAFAVGVGMALDVLDWPLRTFEDDAASTA